MKMKKGLPEQIARKQLELSRSELERDIKKARPTKNMVVFSFSYAFLRRI
jgi:hypothetical protein